MPLVHAHTNPTTLVVIFLYLCLYVLTDAIYSKTDGNHLTMFYVFYPHNIYIIQFVSVRGIH